MAISFTDLNCEAGLKFLDEYLSGKTYLSGEHFTMDDVKVFAAISLKPEGKFSNARRWYESIPTRLAYRFPGQAVGVRLTGTSLHTTTTSLADDTKEEMVDGDDDLDLFGDETEDDKKASEERAAARSSVKKKESGKSSILLEVKPWDDETDMKKLEEAVRAVQMPGLLWGASKLVPVGYGIKKMQIMMTIEDDLVSVDNLIEDYLLVEPANEYIQSCDIVAFNKI